MLLKSFQTEIAPNAEQATQINRTIGVCRYCYNFFIAENQRRYQNGEKFMGYMDFSKWLNNEYLPAHPEYGWMKEVSSKSVKQSLSNADKAFRRFFQKQAGFPRFKKKSRGDMKMYFVKNDAKAVIPCERHRIKIPTLGWVRLKEYGYLPTNRTIKSGTVSKEAGRYYITVLVDSPEQKHADAFTEGIGIDLGVKAFAVVSNGAVYESITKTARIKRLEKKLRREQRRLSRKCESLKRRQNKKKGMATRQNIRKQKLVVEKVHQQLANIRRDYSNKIISELVKTKPAYITVEDLNVRGMMKNRHLSKAVSQQGFYGFRMQLASKCHEYGIELRVVDRFYPSSKACHECGCIKKDLNLSDRTYVCPECGFTADRDYNASLNLKDAKIYQVA